MKRILFIPTAAAIVFSFTTVYSQNGIGVNTNTPKSSLDDKGSFGKTVTTITSSTTLSEIHSTIVCNNAGTITVTLPAASTCARRLYELKRSSGSSALVTIAGTIDGVTNYLLSYPNQSVTLFSDSTNWYSRDGSGDNANWRLKGNAGTNPSNDFVGTTDAQDLAFRTNNSEKMRIESGGDVGIGTTNPSTKLEVLANASGANVITSINTSVSGYSSVDYKDNSSALRFTVGYANGSATNFAGKAYSNTYGSDFVLSRNAPFTDLFMQGSNGNIGIGNSAPQQNLSVQNGMNIDQANTNNGTTTNILTFGSSSGEGIGSKRTATGNQYGLDFYTGFNNRMVITSAGNVGIGVTAPSCRLDVRDDATGTVGDVKLQLARSTAGDVGMDFNQVGVKSYGIVLRDNTTATGTQGRLSFVDSYFPGGAGTEIMCIGPVPNGNVGINEISPSAKLHISSNSNTANTRPLVLQNGGGNNANTEVTLRLSPSTAETARGVDISAVQLGANNIDMKFSLSGTNIEDPACPCTPTEKVRITADGYVGIRTSSPATYGRLTVMSDGDGGAQADNIAIVSRNATPSPSLMFYSSRGSEATKTNVATSTNIMNIHAYARINGVDNQETARLTAVYTGDGTTNESSLAFANSGTNIRMYIDEDGDVGIGTVTPGCKLDVVGGTSISYSNYGRGNTTNYSAIVGPTNITTSIRANNFIAGQGFIATSDARVKKDIVQVNNNSDLDVIKKINLVHFKYIDSLENSTVINKGVIAQEIKKIIPEAVNQSRKVIPNVFELSQKLMYDSVLKKISITVSKPHDFKVGDTIRVYDSEDKMHDVVVAKTSNQNTFTINDWNTYTSRFFVYGKFVNDFHTVNYDYLFTTGLSAMQEMIRHQESQEKQIEQLKSSNQSILNRLAEIESLLKGELKDVSVCK